MGVEPMLVVIPTYRRTATLKWVLQSLVQCWTESIPESIRVLVVNNYPPAKEEITAIVSTFSHEKRFEWNILHREKTLPPVENWYSAIFENAEPDEVVFINSDDDLFLPWSLANRYSEIQRLRADCLLAQVDSGLFFYKQASRVYYASRLCHLAKAGKDSAVLLNIGDIFFFDPVLISNHCYRNTAAFRAGFEKALSWCDAEDWLDCNTCRLMITVYLPYALLLVGGAVAGLQRKCIIRGRELEEIVEARYGVHSWNSGFAILCALGVLGNTELRNIQELEPIRLQYRTEFTRLFLTCLWDPRVDRAMFFETLRRVEFPISQLLSLKTLYGLRLILGDLLGLRGLWLRLVSAKRGIPAELFMKQLAELR
jgi:hypothetical protein